MLHVRALLGLALIAGIGSNAVTQAPQAARPHLAAPAPARALLQARLPVELPEVSKPDADSEVVRSRLAPNRRARSLLGLVLLAARGSQGR